jgi:hypothetical protein
MNSKIAAPAAAWPIQAPFHDLNAACDIMRAAEGFSCLFTNGS